MQVSRQIGWSQESNLLYQILKQLNQLTSVIFGLKPKYKVYTALLTQSGGDNVLTLFSGDSLTIGVTYTIKGYAANDDFSNVGGPPPVNETEYWTDYSFVATGTTPSVWTSTSLDYNTGAPVVTVLENTIGNVWWTYSSDNDGVYYGNLISGFPLDKTYYSVNSRFSDDGGASAYDAFLLRSTDDFFILSTWNNGTSSNSLIAPNNPLSIEIRVYN